MKTHRLPELRLPQFGHLRNGTATVTVRHAHSLSGEIVDGERRARAAWTLAGDLVRLVSIDARGRRHGLDYEVDDGRVQWQQAFRYDVAHGLVKQYDRRGRLLVTSRFEAGSGVDVFCNDDGSISEAREVVNDLRHGLEIFGLPRRPYSEGRFCNGLRHGIFRVWDDGALKEGYPQYFVNDMEVTRAEYRELSTRWTLLPRDRRADDANRRPWPAAMFARVKLFFGEDATEGR